MKGIYIIKNIINNKVYIGESIDILNRLKEHESYPFYNGTCRNKQPKLYPAIRAWGINNFEFKILKILDDKATKKDLWAFEEFYIWYYDSFYNGYNCTPGGINGNYEYNLKQGSEKWNDERRIAASERAIITWSDNNKKKQMAQKVSESWNENRKNFMSENNKQWFENHPEEKEKRSIKMSGGNNPKAKKLFDINTGIIYDTANEAGWAAGSKAKEPCRAVMQKVKNNLPYLGHLFKLI